MFRVTSFGPTGLYPLEVRRGRRLRVFLASLGCRPVRFRVRFGCLVVETFAEPGFRLLRGAWIGRLLIRP